jgi:hypothetical protein
MKKENAEARKLVDDTALLSAKLMQMEAKPGGVASCIRCGTSLGRRSIKDGRSRAFTGYR